MCVCVHVCVCVCVCVCVHVCVCVLFMYICGYMYTCVCEHVVLYSVVCYMSACPVSHWFPSCSLPVHFLFLQKSRADLSNELYVESLQVVLLEGEVVFWTISVLEAMEMLRGTEGSRAPPPSLPLGQQGAQEKTPYLSYMFGQPVAVVTKVELVDWSLLVRMEAPSLQSREPLCALAMASFVSCVQWGGGAKRSKRLR